MKILYYGETPCIVTGTALLSKNLLQFMLDFGHELEVIGVNHHSDVPHDEELYPFKIHRCPDGEAYNLELARELIKNAEYDLLFLSTDVSQINSLAPAIQERKQQKDFPVISYSAIDCDVISQQVIAGLSHCDQVVMYSEHGCRTAIKYSAGMRLNIRYIYPGCEPDVFYPLPEEERREQRKKLFGIGDKTKLFMNANRNQWRKDMGRTLMIFQEFRKTCQDSFLYMHAKNSDVGGCLSNMAAFLGMRTVQPGMEVMFTSPDFHERSGVSREFLNTLYNCADALVSTTTGEGFGLTTTDAMSAQRPVIVPRNTSAIEIVGENEERGYLVKAGGDIDHQFIHYGMTDNPRDIVHSQDMIRAMEEVYFYPEKAAEKAKAAREWTLDHTWAHAKVQWQALFAQIASEIDAKVGVTA